MKGGNTLELHERIKYLRKDILNLSQESFGERLGVSRSVIKNIELNVLARPDQKLSLIKLMSKEFNISENWLLHGEGEMFIELNKEDQLMQWATDVFKDRNDSFRKRFVTALSSLGEEEWELIEKFSLKLLEEIHSDTENENIDITREEDLQKLVVDVDDIDENDPNIHPDIRKHIVSEKKKRNFDTQKEIG